MEKLLKIAMDKAGQAEVYYTEGSSDSISYSDGKLDKADSSLSSGLALRIIKDGKVGFAHTRNLLDPGKLVEQALQSAKTGMDVGFSFPKTEKAKELKFDPTIENLSKKELLSQGKELIDYVKTRSDGRSI